MFELFTTSVAYKWMIVVRVKEFLYLVTTALAALLSKLINGW